MLKRLIAYLAARIRDLEHRAVGSAEAALSPLTRVYNELLAVENRAHVAAEKARAEVAALAQHVVSLNDKAADAATAIAKLASVLK